MAYRSPALFGESLECLCRVAWAGRSSFGLDYLVEAADSPLGHARTVAEGWTVQVFYDPERGAVARMPDDLRALIEAFEGRPVPSRPPRPGLRPRSGEGP